MNRITSVSSNLSPEDRRTYRRWTRGLFASYLAAITLAVGLTFLNRAATDPDTVTRTTHLKPASAMTAMSIVRR